MIRQPTPYSVALSWWRAAIAGQSPPRHEGDPQAGFYRTRERKGGAWVPARIFIERETDPRTGDLVADEVLVLEVNGIRQSDPHRRWTYLEPVSRGEYDHLAFHQTLSDEAKRVPLP